MSRIEEFLELARRCYAQARATLHPETRTSLQRMGDDYIRKAEKVDGKPVRAVFPDPASGIPPKIGR